MRGSGGYPLLRFYKKPTLPDWLRRGGAGNLTRTSPRLSASLLTTHHGEGLDRPSLSPSILGICRPWLPSLSASGFSLSQVEGREPLALGGHRGQHRDQPAQRPGDIVQASVFRRLRPRERCHSQASLAKYWYSMPICRMRPASAQPARTADLALCRWPRISIFLVPWFYRPPKSEIAQCTSTLPYSHS